MDTKIKIDGCDYGIKDESKSSRITSVGSLLWRKGTWNVIARPRNLCAGPNLHSQIVNSALTLTLSLRIFDSKLWLHVSSERREKEFGRGREKSGRKGGVLRVSEAENGVTTDNWNRCVRKRPPFFPLRQIFEALEQRLSTFIHGQRATSHYVSDIT